MKEFGPVGGGARRKLLYVDPPLATQYCICNSLIIKNIFCKLNLSLMFRYAPAQGGASGLGLIQHGLGNGLNCIIMV